LLLVDLRVVAFDGALGSTNSPTVALVERPGTPCFSSSTRRHSMAAGCGRFFLAAVAAAGARAVVAPLRILDRSSRSREHQRSS
jgi:hypothetical protein